MQNPVTGTQVTQADLLLVIGDQTVTIAVLRQQLGEARAENAKRQEEQQARSAAAKPCDPALWSECLGV